ncbi:MAG: hypothetical protein ACREA2_04380 [Blastocatellia bacterium]
MIFSGLNSSAMRRQIFFMNALRLAGESARRCHSSRVCIHFGISAGSSTAALFDRDFFRAGAFTALADLIVDFMLAARWLMWASVIETSARIIENPHAINP